MLSALRISGGSLRLKLSGGGYSAAALSARVAATTSARFLFSTQSLTEDNSETPISAETAAPQQQQPLEFFKQHQISIRGIDLDSVRPIFTFDDAKLAAPLQKAMQRQGFDAPTPIQSASWPIIAEHKRDLISVARTGSGKTLGFLMPAIQKILEKSFSNNQQSAATTATTATGQRGNQQQRQQQQRRTRYRAPRVLVLAPTRELTQQIGGEARKYQINGAVVTTEVFGGTGKGDQIRALRSGVDIVVATPGRCNDLCEMGELELSQIEYLVLDEADRMLDMGFEPQIRSIIDQIPAAPLRQTLFFTATWPREVQQLAGDFLTNPVQVNVGDQNTLNANKAIAQHFQTVKPVRKEEALLDLLQNTISSNTPDGNPHFLPRTLVFVNRKAVAEELCFSLRRAGFSARALHGDKSQQYRSGVLDNFRSGRVNLLIATDVAARGLDVKDIQYVVNYDFPDSVESYVHRIGRTARGDSAGISHTLLSPSETNSWKLMKDLAELLKRSEQPVPEDIALAAASYRGGSGGGSSGGRGGGRFGSRYSRSSGSGGSGGRSWKGNNNSNYSNSNDDGSGGGYRNRWGSGSGGNRGDRFQDNRDFDRPQRRFGDRTDRWSAAGAEQQPRLQRQQRDDYNNNISGNGFGVDVIEEDSDRARIIAMRRAAAATAGSSSRQSHFDGRDNNIYSTAAAEAAAAAGGLK